MFLGLPVADWQFWVVTAAVAAGLALATRRFWRRLARRKRGVRTTLTIGGRPAR